VLSDLAEIHARYPDMAAPAATEAAVITLPLIVRNDDVGVLVLTFRRARRFHDDEIAMLETLAGRCAGAITRARLYEEQRTASLTLQRRLLPELPASPEWLELGARYEPTAGGEVGGDWYQVLMLDDGRCVVALGDAVGRGITAAAAMGQLRAAIAGAASVDAHPSSVVAATSRHASVSADTRCASLVYAVVDGALDIITYAIAGHPPPIIVRADGELELLTDGRSPLLGIAGPSVPVPSGETRFRPGDTLVLYTDGLVERRGASIDDGVGHLAERVAQLGDVPGRAMADAIVDAAIAGRSSDDDIAVLVVRRTR
jgi:serine phosphatase RsbU (regulator of sigma subunit)